MLLWQGRPFSGPVLNRLSFGDYSCETWLTMNNCGPYLSWKQCIVVHACVWNWWKFFLVLPIFRCHQVVMNNCKTNQKLSSSLRKLIENGTHQLIIFIFCCFRSFVEWNIPLSKPTQNASFWQRVRKASANWSNLRKFLLLIKKEQSLQFHWSKKNSENSRIVILREF